MKRIILVYGLIAGTIVGSMFFITMPLYEKGILTMENGELVGYSTMIVALSLIFFDIKSYRDNHLQGSITFWGGFESRVTDYVNSFAHLCHHQGGDLQHHDGLCYPDGDKYFEKLRAEGTTKAKIDEYAAMYANPIIRFSMTLMEIAPLGILISLLSAGLLRMKGFLPPSSNN
jgi:hypothetical protein